jgi:hypothetical protein
VGSSPIAIVFSFLFKTGAGSYTSPLYTSYGKRIPTTQPAYRLYDLSPFVIPLYDLSPLVYY